MAEEWMNVDENPPKLHTKVFGYCESLGEVRNYYISEKGWQLHNGTVNTAKGFGITKWMPIPEAKTGAKNELHHL